MRCRCSTSAPPASSRSGWPRRPGARWRSTCTSGTAAANLHPAVIEAQRGARAADRADRRPPARAARGRRRPVDRPAQALRRRGQVVRARSAPTSRAARPPSTTARSPAAPTATAAGGRPGPGAPQLPAARAARARARAARRRRLGRAAPTAAPGPSCASTPPPPHADDVQRAGRARSPPSRAARSSAARPREDVAEPAARLAAACGWPLLAEPTSGVRCGPHDRSHVVAHYDVLLRVERFARRARARPACCASATCPPRSRCAPGPPRRRQVVLDPHAAWHEPTRRAELLLRSAAAPALDALGRRRRDARSARATPDWLASLARRRRAGRPPRSPRRPTPFEPKAARRARAGAARRRARLAQLLDADPRRRGLLPAVAQAAALPRPTAAPTGSTAWSRRPPAPRWPPARRPGC